MPEPRPDELTAPDDLPVDQPLPYHLRDDFLSSAELSLYHVLGQTVDQAATILVKVSLGDLFYAKAGDRAANHGYRNKINRKHIDFLPMRAQNHAPHTRPRTRRL